MHTSSSSIVLCCALIACSPKQSSVHSGAEPTPIVSEPEQSQTEEDTNIEETLNENPNPSIGSPLGSLDKSIIDDKIKEVLPDVKACYSEGLIAKPDLTGRVVIKMVIGKDGVVSSAESNPEKTSLDSPEVVECITSTVKQLVFPPPNGGVVIVSYPFALIQ